MLSITITFAVLAGIGYGLSRGVLFRLRTPETVVAVDSTNTPQPAAPLVEAAAATVEAIPGQSGDTPTTDPGGETSTASLRTQIDAALQAGDTKALITMLARPGFPREDPELLAAVRRALVTAAEGGHAEAMLALGILGKSGFFGTADVEETARWLERAGDAGRPEGYAEAARLYMDGRLTAPDPIKAAALIEKGIAAGNADSHLLKGITLLSPSGDAAAALGLIRQAAGMGSGDAALLLSRLYKDGHYVARDEQAALEWAARAAELGSLGGQVDLGKLLTRLGRTPDVIGEGVESLLDADARKSSRSALELARLIVNAGRMSPADAAAAKTYAEDAFARGHSRGAFAAAMLSFTPGADIAAAEAEAREWLQGGSQAGDWQSKYALMLARDGAMTLREAMRRAARANHAEYFDYSTKQSAKNLKPGFVPPSPISMPAPRFPDGLLVLGTTGTVKAKFLVGPDGVPQNVEVLGATHPQLAEAAVAAVSQWRFKPATVNGAYHPITITVPFRFRSPD